MIGVGMGDDDPLDRPQGTPRPPDRGFDGFDALGGVDPAVDQGGA